MKSKHSNNRPLKQNSNRLAAYLALGVGAGLVATPSAEAAIVTIDLTSTGFGLDGVNAGVSGGRNISNFPISGSGTLAIYSAPGYLSGISSSGNLFIASGNLTASPTKFSQNQPIGSSANWVNQGSGYFNSFFLDTSYESPDFGAGSYMGFKTAQGNYGWLEVTWAGATDTFQIYSGAYESTAGVAIFAGDTGGGTSAVPEPGQEASSLLLLALGAAGVAIQRQRAKKKQAVAVAQS